MGKMGLIYPNTTLDPEDNMEYRIHRRKHLTLFLDSKFYYLTKRTDWQLLSKEVRDAQWLIYEPGTLNPESLSSSCISILSRQGDLGQVIEPLLTKLQCPYL